MRIGRSGSLAGGVFVLLVTTATAPLGAQVTPGTAGSPAVITGRVQGEGAVALPAANVLIPEMNISVGTNENGVYTITIAPERVRGQTVTIRARAIGFAPLSQQVTIAAGRREANFTLQRDVNRLSEVVVTGVAAATERVKVPFAVTRIDSTQTPVPGINPLAQLQGKVPGANIVSASGRPGAQPSVLLRGPKSINAAGRSQDPLYIVDGVILTGGIADLNALDVESVEVVKGAAAASLYGSQAANGVIQITTKKGRATDGVRFGARVEYGVGDIERPIAISKRHSLLMDETLTRFCIGGGGLTAQQQLECYRSVDWSAEAMRINDTNSDFASPPALISLDPGATIPGSTVRRTFQVNPWPGANYDAVEQVANPGPVAIANVDMNAKVGNTDVFAAINTTQQQGSIRYLEGYTRNSVRLNANQNIGNTWNVALNTFYADAEEDGLNQQNGFGGGGNAFFRLTRTPPVVDLLRRDSQGRLLVRPNIQNGGQQNENALYSLENNRRVDFTRRFVGALTARYTPNQWVNADASIGYDNSDKDGRRFRNRGFRTPTAQPINNGDLFNFSQTQQSLNGSIGVSMPNVSPWRSLVLSPSLRTSFLRQDFKDRNVNGTQLVVSGVEDPQNATQNTLTVTAERRDERQITYAGGLRAELLDRYIFDGAVRRDGNSTFGPEERWANYFRVAGSWIVTNESWMQGLSDRLDLLKLTANYGTSGLAPRFSAQYETYDIGAGGSLTPNRLGNPFLKPQVDRGSEFTIEVGALRAINFTATYALSHTFDQILPVPLPASEGFREQWQNAGTLQNKTWEMSLGFPFARKGKLDWNGRVNYERTLTTITQLNVPPYFTGGDPNFAANTGNLFRIADKEKMGSFYGRTFYTDCAQLPEAFVARCGGAGSEFQKNADGLIVWTNGADLGEGITRNLWNASLPADRSPSGFVQAWGHPITRRDLATGAALSTKLGEALPKFRLAHSQNLSWGRLTAFGLLDGAFGQKVYNQGRHWAHLDFLSGDLDQDPNDVGGARPSSYYYRAGPPDNVGVGGLYDVLSPSPIGYFTENASYMKLREITVTYRLGRLGGAVGGDWTVGITGRNLKTWTDYQGFDPEVGLTGGTSAGQLGSGALVAVDAFTFPNTRTFSFSISTRF